MQLRKTLGETDNKGGLKKHGMNAGWGGVGKRRPTAFLGSSHQKNNDDEDFDPDIFAEFAAATRQAGPSNSGDEENNELGTDLTTNDESMGKSSTLRQETKEYLPQLLAAALHSPPALTNDLDPMSTLRSLLIDRCLIDPDLGIALCWLLEAEVGRKWKELFEHRQRTGRRLILVAPADKAAALVKIGVEKSSAFDLLQDAEQATAFGSHMPESAHATDDQSSEVPTPPSLPASLSQRRCSHYGDTMHFLDKLTQISLDLGGVPALQRMAYLKESLCELNRRVRRRMYTKGEVSLDVEDNRAAFDWPTTEDIDLDMLKHSVHFALEPKSVTWPGPDDYNRQDPSRQNECGVMRVLNIVSEDARIMASRERCPFLVLLEVAETGLEGNDARLYASGVDDVSVTLEEAMGLRGITDDGEFESSQSNENGFTPYQIPAELMVPSQSKILRGGWQDDGNSYYSSNPGWGGHGVPSPYEMMRQEEIEQLHQTIQDSGDPSNNTAPPPQGDATDQSIPQGPAFSTGKGLLDKVYGLPWDVRCDEIRKASSYGKIKGWRLASFIMKAGEDIRKEALVMQIISKMKGWFDAEIPEVLRPYLRPYTIMCIGGEAGIVECVHDAKSVDEVKKQTDGFTSLRDFFERAFGAPGAVGPAGSLSFEQAQDNFLRSLVGYSLVCYVLQIKDRHNANILMSRDGHLMHIDFGFVLGETPKMGYVPLFSERAPFKLTQDYWDVLGGWNIREGGLGVKFCKMFEEAFACASSHADEIATIIESAMLNLGYTPRAGKLAGDGAKERLRMRGSPNSRAQKNFIMDLVEASLISRDQTTYDMLQRAMNGYQ